MQYVSEDVLLFMRQVADVYEETGIIVPVQMIMLYDPLTVKDLYANNVIFNEGDLHKKTKDFCQAVEYELQLSLGKYYNMFDFMYLTGVSKKSGEGTLFVMIVDYQRAKNRSTKQYFDNMKKVKYPLSLLLEDQAAYNDSKP